VNCHHNYVARERHFGADVLVTRKGAVRARLGDLGIIPGSMGAKSYIVRGKGNPESFCSCSHGAGRAMSRTEAKRRFTVADHAAATAGVECRKDADVIDETPAAYKADRRGDGGAGRPGRRGAHAAAGGVREGLVSYARYTTAMPPRPSSPRSW
jgi:RNA-splicing ligase RtcB